ncbi:MAG: glycosyltransferase [Deinococcota bacterium]
MSANPSVAVVIPAFNEASTVASVIAVAQASELGSVYVIDDGSSDPTAQASQDAGSTVHSLPQNQGKGGALAFAANVLNEDVLVLVDADLTDLKPHHVQQLAAPVLVGDAHMTRGIFKGGRFRTTAAQYLAPQLSGQRAVLRSKLAEVEGLAESRYGVEIVITQHASKHRWRTQDVWLEGVSQIMKEEKRGVLRGFWIRLGMYGDILKAYWQHWVKT